jgi:hypothetical protein
METDATIPKEPASRPWIAARSPAVRPAPS